MTTVTQPLPRRREIWSYPDDDQVPRSMTMTDTIHFDPELTINEIVAAYPETISVFNRFGLDTCCGGGVCVDEAARRDGIDARPIVAALNDVLSKR